MRQCFFVVVVARTHEHNTQTRKTTHTHTHPVKDRQSQKQGKNASNRNDDDNGAVLPLNDHQEDDNRKKGHNKTPSKLYTANSKIEEH